MRVAVCVAGIALLFCVTACKELFADIEEDFSYWASEPTITGFRAASPAQTSPAGVQCVPSANDVTLTLTVRNPKKFSFVMPGSSGAPTDIVTFGSDVHDSLGTNPPLLGTDYTLEQSALDTLKLTYKEAFLKRYEWSSANIGAAIKLYSTDGRKFNQTYKFNLESNTPPPTPAHVEASDDFHIALFKTATDDSLGKRYYVLCFKVDGMPGENVISGVPLYGDIKSVCVSKNDGIETPYTVTLKSDHTDFDVSQSGGTFISKNDVVPLSSTEAAAFLSSLQPDNVPSASWTLYLKTDIEVGGATAKYSIRLFDGKLYSALSEQTIGKRPLPTPKVFAHTDMDNTVVSGVYTEKGATNASGNEDLNATNNAAHSGSETDPIPVYSAYGDAVKLTIKKSDGTDYPAGVTVTGSAEKHSGDSVSGTASFTAGQSAAVTLPSPTNGGGEAVYKVVFKATGEGFDDSTTRTLYYKVCREVKAVSSTLPMWHILKEAIAHTSAGGTVVVNGEIKATNASDNHAEIEITKDLTIKKAAGASTAVINANKTVGGKSGHRIFLVKSGTLTLENLTLQGGICPVGASGGGMYIKPGAGASLTDCRITDCKSSLENGGAVYTQGTLSLTRGSIGGTGHQEGNEARYGGGIYVAYNGSCTITETKILKNYANGGTSSSSEGRGGGIYVERLGTCSLNNVDDMQGNSLKPSSPGKGAGIYVASEGICNIAGSTKIEANGVQANDVYLAKYASDQSKNAKITVTGTLLGTHTVAKITPEDYTAGVTAVNAASGVNLAGCASRFKITDQTIISPPSTVPWKLIYNSNNTLVLKSAAPTVIPSGGNAWKTLKEAIEAESVEDGDEFLVQGTITATSATDNYGAITVRKKITVKGDGTSPTLNANKNGINAPPTPHRIFIVENGAELTLEDITLTGGMATGAGDGENGGAILIKEGGAANIKNTQIYECKATNGGAIYNKGSLSLSLCHIGDNGKPNEATDDGGAIFSQTTATAHFTILGTEIKHNTAGRSGGGICIISGKCTISSEGSTPTLIDNNTCSGSTTIGGGLHIGAGGDCTISGDTKISNNSCANGSGGGVCVSGTFVMEGGARVVPPSVAVAGKNDVLLMPGKYITLKSALSGTDPVALITPSRYESDRKILKGEGYTLTASDANRFAVTPEIVNGVTHEWELIPDSENFCKLKMGDAIIPGAGSDRWQKLKTEAEKTNGPDVIIVDGEIKAGAGIGNSGEIKIGRNLTIKGKTGEATDKLDADNRSRIFKVENGKTLTLEKLTLKNGKVTGYGGGIYAGTGTTVNLDILTTIQECEATDGGAIYNDGGTLTIKGASVIKGNEVTNNGGAFLIKSGSLYMENNCIVEQNKAKKGGGIYITDSGSATIRYCRASQNEAQDDGGGIYVAGNASCTLDGVTMQDNTVNNGKGSAVYVAKENGKTPTITLKGNVQIGDSTPNSNTICLGYALSGSTIQTAFVSAKSAELSGSPHINIEPEDYIKQNKKDLIKGEGIGWKYNLFHLTNIPTSEGSWTLTNSPGGSFNSDIVALERTSANLTASGPGSWNALKEAIESLPFNGGTLILNGRFKATSGDDNIIINRVLTIDGKNSAVIDADDKCRIFKMIGGSLILKDITLENGSATGSGEEAYGGGVYVKNGQFTMQGSTRIVPPAPPLIAGKNDVYLKNGRMINIVDALTGAKPVACITPEDYTSGTQVLNGDIIEGTPQKNYKKFKVTPVSAPYLYVGSDGKLTYTP